MIVDGGAVPALVRCLQAPPVAEMGGVQVAFEHEVEKGCAFMLGLLAVKVSFGNCVCDWRDGNGIWVSDCLVACDFSIDVELFLRL